MALEYLQRHNGAASLIILHGFGASARDVSPIGDYPAAEQYRCIFPEAPKEIEISGQVMGRAWFPRDEEGLRRALFGTFFSDVRTLDPPGLAASGRELVDLCRRLEIEPDSLVLAGFSQGAMVALESALAMTDGVARPAGLILFSAALIAAERWSRQLSRLSGIPVFQSHGRQDPVLNVQQGRALGELLDSAGCERTYHEFDGTHAIPTEVLDSAFQSLSSMLPGT